jgi:sulfofructose kinase
MMAAAAPPQAARSSSSHTGSRWAPQAVATTASSSAGIVIALGAAGVDTIYAVPRSWQHQHQPGSSPSAKLLPTECAVIGAGMAASAAAAVARLGGRAELWARVGDDAQGDFFVADLRKTGVDTTHVRRLSGGRTTISTVLVDPRGERLVVPYYDPLLDRQPGWLPLGRLRRDLCSCLLVDVRWLDGAVAALSAAQKAGVPSVLDADTAEAGVLRQLVPLADYVIFSEPGLRIHYRGDDDSAGGAGGNDGWGVEQVDEALRHAACAAGLDGAQPGRACVGVTLGESGWRWLEPSKSADDGLVLHVSPAPRVTARDTLSAGDVFHGVFAHGIAEVSVLRCYLATAVTAAIVTAACACLCSYRDSE